MIGCLLSIVLLTSATGDSLTVLSSTRDATEVRLVVPEPTWEHVTVRGRSYQAVRVEQTVPRGMPGEPELPVYRFAVAIPPGSEPRVTVSGSERVSFRDVSLPPAPRTALLPPARGHGLQPVSLPTDPVPVAEPYPAVRARIVRTGRLRSMDIAYVEVCPFQYYPSQRLLCLDRNLTVTVSTPGGPSVPRRALEADFMEPVLSSLVLNWDEARQWRQGRPVALTRDIRHWAPPFPAFKLLVDHEAFYSVTGAQLSAAGMPIATVDPHTLRLLAGGEEIPLHVRGAEDGRFDPDDRVEFIGEPVYREDQGNRIAPVGGPFTETNVYWLTWGGAQGVRMQIRTVEAQGSGIRPSSFRERAHLERDLNPFIPNLAATSGDRYGTEWFWGPPLIPGDGRVYYSFTLRGRAAVANGVQLRAALRGYTHPDLMQNPHHHAIVYLNDRQLAHLLWYANDEAFYDSRTDPYYDPSAWPNSVVLNEGTNAFAVEITGDTQYGWMDGAYTDWFEVDYWRDYRAWNDSLAFWSPQHQGPGTYLYTVSGFSDSGQILLDLTHRQILQGYREAYQGVSDGWAVTFRDATVDSTRYLALAATHREAVAGIVEEHPSDLHGAPGADFVIISHPELMDQAQRLAPERSFHGTPISSTVVDVHDVYDEYRFGVFDPRGIRDFLEDAYVHWQVPPSFVLLFGDASWDYKLNSPSSDPLHRNFVPSWSNPALDDYFANVDDAGGTDSLVPDLYMARIAVENAETAAVVVDKLLRYLSGDWDPGSWRENVFLVSGGHQTPSGADDRSMFKSQCQTLINQWVLPEPAHYNAILFARQESLNFNNEFETTEDESLQHYFNDVGVVHATYIGHGASWTWQTMFWASDIENDLTNTRMLPMVNSMTCHTGRFANPEIDSFGEIWLWQPHGAMGHWGSTGWGNSNDDYYMASKQFEVIFRNQERHPIVALLAAKLAPSVMGNLDEPMSSPLFFTWLGDPLVRLGLAERPDWRIGAMTVEPQPCVSGDTIHVAVTVRNDGIDPGPGTILRLFDADPDSGGAVLATLPVPSLAAAESLEVAWVTTAAGTAGERRVYAWANPDTAQQEGYRGNNRGMTTYNVIDPVPDLITADSMLHVVPATPQVLDSMVTFAVEVRNTGTGPAGAFRVLFTDFFVAAGTLREIADVVVDGLARGGSTTLEVEWHFTDTDAGDHVVRVVVDSLNVISELDESNNTATASVHIASRAELVAQLLRPSNTRPPEGDSLTLTGVWGNVGESATPAYEVAVYHGHPDSAGSSLVHVESRATTAGGEIDSMVVVWDTIGQVGTHAFYLVVDRAGAVPELHENDNICATSLEVVSGPDLFVSSLVLDPQHPVEGDSATLAFTIRNGGMIPADSFTVLLNLDGETIREWRFDSAGRSSQTLTHSWEWQRGSSQGSHTIELVVDAYDEVAETNEGNNEQVEAVYVMSLADLAVTLTPSDTALVDGDTVILGTSVANLGEASAHTVRVRWDRQVDGGWAPVDSVVLATLEGGQTTAKSTSVPVRPGIYTFRVQASTPVEEQRLDNNEAFCSVSVRALTPPDLVLQGVVVAADTVTVGESASVQIGVANAGETAPDSAWVELRDVPGDSLVLHESVAPPAPGAVSTVRLSWMPPHGESLWRIVTRSIPEDAVPGNEADTVRVVAVWPAELQPEGGLVATPLRPLAGDTVRVVVVVRNSGERPAPLFTVALFRGNPSPGHPEAQLVATETPPDGLNPGDTTTVVLPWATPDEPGAADLYAWIDAAQLVPERDEGNNLLSTRIEILTRSFVVDPVIPLPSPAPGRTGFVVHASHEATAEVRIYTVTGRLVEILGPTAVAPARREAISWSCTDRDGDRVANGVYLYRVEVTSDRTGERSRHEGKLVVRR